MKIYEYKPGAYQMTILVPLFFMAVLFIWAIYSAAAGNFLWLHELILFAMPVLFLSSFVGLHNPSKIEVSQQAISFFGFGRKHEYKWTEAGTIYVKRYDYVGKTFIRIGKPRIFGGRYWITNEMQGYKQLISLLEETTLIKENRHENSSFLQKK